MRATTHVLKGNGSALRWLQRWLARGSTGRGITVGGRPAMPRLSELTANYAAATGPRPGANAIRHLKFHPATQPYRPPLEAWLRAGRSAAGPRAATRHQCSAHPWRIATPKWRCI